MRQTITISISQDVKKELDKLTREEGLSRSDIVRDSLRDYLFVHRFHSLRKRMISKAKGKGIYTDQDVFDRVS
jgi:metal-responsive CopG/Arc/MetJ family transcriptional regulator